MYHPAVQQFLCCGPGFQCAIWSFLDLTMSNLQCKAARLVTHRDELKQEAQNKVSQDASDLRSGGGHTCHGDNLSAAKPTQPGYLTC